jgi:hypothetical protein
LAKIPLDRRLVALDEEDGQLAVTGRKGPENVLDGTKSVKLDVVIYLQGAA